MRVIGEAGIRLSATGESGLVKDFQAEGRRAAAALKGTHLLGSLDKNTDDDSKKITSRLKALGEVALRSLGGLSSGAASAALLGGKLTLVATAAGAGLAAVTSLVTGLVGFVGVAGQAAGAAGLIPVAMLAAKTAMLAFKVGLNGVDDAVKALAEGDMEKLDKALKDMSPEAQKVFGALRTLSPEIKTFKNTVQDSLFQGLGTPLKSLVSNYLPLVQGFFAGITHEANGALKQTLGFLNSVKSQVQVASIFDNIHRSVAQLAPAFQPFVQAFLSFMQVGTGFLPGFAEGLAEIVEKVSGKITTMAANGQLQAFFSRALSVAGDLFQVVKDIGAGFVQVFRAAQIAGGGFLGNLKGIASQFKNFTQSAQGFDALITFFQSMRTVLGAVLPVVTSLVQVIAADLAPILADIAEAVGPALTTVVKAIGEALRAAGPGVTAFAQGFAKFLEGIAPALPALGRLAGVIGDTLGHALTELAPVVEQVAEVFADTLAEVLPDLIPPLTDLAKVVGQLLIAFTPIIPPLAKIAGQLLTALARILEKLGPPLADFVTKLIDDLAPYIGPLVDAFLALVDAVMPLVDPFLQLVTAVLEPLLPLLGPISDLLTIIANILKPIAELLGAILSVLANAISGLGDFISYVGEGASNVFTLATNGFNTMDAVTRTSISRMNGYWDEHGKFIKGTFDDAATQAVADLFGIPTASQQAWDKLKAQAQGTFGGMSSSAAQNLAKIDIAMNNLFGVSVPQSLGRAGSAATGAFNKMASGAADGAKRAKGSVTTMGDSVKGYLDGLSSPLHQSGRAAVGGFAQGILDSVGRAKDAARTVVNAVEALFPHSPAKEGPFSGRGWTPFRGRALVEGFAQGILSSASAASGAAAILMTQVASQLSPQGSVDISRAAAPGAAASSAGGGGTLHQTVLALPGMDVRQLGDYVMEQAALGVTALGTVLPVSRGPVQNGVDDNFALGVSP